MHQVFFKKIEKYDVNKIANFLFFYLSSQGIKSLKGSSIVIKPNFLKPSIPEKAIITHPDVIKAAIILFCDLGARVIIGDSPGFGNIYKVIEKAELSNFLKKHNVKVTDFSMTKKVRIEGYLYKEIEIPIEIIEASYVCNMPKLKTHQMMFLTMAVKNLFGCIYGLKKISYHLTAGKDYNLFATLLLDIYTAIKPKINILDAITGMEGNGPSSGEPRNFGFIAAGSDALSLDMIVSEFLEIPAEMVPYLKIAKQKGLKEVDSKEIIIEGINEIVIKGKLKYPPNYSTNFRLPKLVNNFVNSFFVSYPWVSSLCKGCGICKKHCPAGAIIIKGIAKIDKRKCIRCFCCQELCNYNAIKVKNRLF